MSDESSEVMKRSVISDRRWIVIKSGYMALAHAVIIILLFNLITQPDDRSEVVDGDLFAKRIFLRYKNGKIGVEIGALDDGSSIIKLNDTEGRTRLSLSTGSQDSRIDVFSDSGDQRIAIGEYPELENQAAVAVAGPHGTSKIGASDIGTSIAFSDVDEKVLVSLGFSNDQIARLILSDLTSELILKAPNSENRFFKKSIPWNMISANLKQQK